MLGTMRAATANFTFSNNDSMAYVSNVTFSVNGTVSQRFDKPSNLVNSGVLLATTGQNGIITYGTSQFATTMSGLTPASSSTPPTSVTSAPQDLVPSIQGKTNPSDVAILARLANDWLYPVFNGWSELSGWRVVTMYRMVLLILAIALYAILIFFTRHQLFAVIPGCVLFGYGYLMLTVIPWYGFLAILLLAVGLAMTEGRQTI